MRIRPHPWTIATALVATTLFVLAIRPDVYEATSPYWLSWHVLLRKIYSVGAFFLVAFLFRGALRERGATRFVVRAVVATALYSATIEVAQFATGGREGLLWNAIDTICGAAGGALATADLWTRAILKPRARAPRPR